MTLPNRTLLGHGATADVYIWNNDTVLKQFKPNVPQTWIEQEFAIARSVALNGVNTPTPIEQIEIDNRQCIVYERVYGVEISLKLHQQPIGALKYMRHMVETLVNLHSATIDLELPSLIDDYTRRLQQAPLIDERTRNRLIQHLHSLPPGNAVCHGDYHFKNVMMSDEGAVIIDWLTAVRGNPLFDIARTYVILTEDRSKKISIAPVHWLYSILLTKLRDTFVKHYLEMTDSTWEDVAQWIPIVSGARLLEQSAEPSQLLPLIGSG